MADPASMTVDVSLSTCSSCGSEVASEMAFCGRCGQRVRDVPVQDRAGERRYVTVMFCDIVGSTPLAERLEAEDLQELLGRYQEVCAHAIERLDGHVSKYVGDGLVAYFGYPTAHEDDPRRAALAGLRIVAGMEGLNAAIDEEFGVTLEVRIGIHSGFVVAGEMGAGTTREQFAIVGETPNIAARLEGVAEPGSVVISHATLALAGPNVAVEEIDVGGLRGVSRDVRAFRVLSIGGTEDSSAALRPMVGRDRELERLSTLWARSAGGAGATASVVGEAGIGKSRLVEAWCRSVVESGGTTIVLECSEYQQHSTLHPVVRHLETLLGLAEASPSDQMRGLLELVGVGDLAPRTLPLLASLLSLDSALGWAPPPGDPITVRAETLETLQRLLFARASGAPVGLVVEDAQWADATTLELLTSVVSRIATEPVMIVSTIRSGNELPWTSDLELHLEPLSRPSVRAIVELDAGRIAVSSEVADQIAEASGGVPLYIDELLRMGSVDVRDPGDAPSWIPPTLRGLLTSRLDALGPDRKLVQVASVLGMDVAPSRLGRVLGLESDAVSSSLARLVDAGVFRPPVGTEGVDYRFRHGLLREAAYDSLLNRDRRAHHRATADAVMVHEPQVAARRPEVVARHLSAADLHERSMEFWSSAGTIALANAAFVEAADHFGSAIIAADRCEQLREQDLVDVLMHHAASLQAAFGYATREVDPIYARAESLCGSLGDEGRLASVWRGRWMAHLLRAEYRTARTLGEEMLELGRRRNDTEIELEGHLYVGMVDLYLGSLEAARASLEQAIDLYEPTTHRQQLHETLGDSGVGANAYLAPVLNLLGLIDESERRSDNSLELADAASSPMTRAQAWGMRTLFHLGRGEADLAARWISKTSDLSQSRSLSYWRHLSEIIIGWLEARGGLVDAGTARLRAGLDGYVSSGARLGLPYLWLLAVDLHAELGDIRAGLDLIEVAERHIEDTGERYAQAAVLRSKARLLLMGDAPDRVGAEAALADAVRLARDQGARLAEYRALGELRHLVPSLEEDPEFGARMADLHTWLAGAGLDGLATKEEADDGSR